MIAPNLILILSLNLTLLSMVSYEVFFLAIASTAVLGFVILMFMREPKGSMSEINEDGSVELIGVN